MIGPSVGSMLQTVWHDVVGDELDLARVAFTEMTHVLPSIYRVEALATTSVALVGLAYDALRRSLGEAGHRTTVDGRDAALAFRSEHFLRVNGTAPNLWAPLSGDYRTADGWIRLHANYPQHLRAIVATLDVGEDRAAVERAVGTFEALQLERRILDAGGAAAALRPRATWHALDAGRAVATHPLVEITKIGDAAPQPPHDSPRVLDLTRVISGPLCSKILASLGSDVLRINTPALADIDAALIEGGFGKRAALLDLRARDQHEAFAALVRGADVFVQSHRPGAFDKLGFGIEDAAKLRPGIVYVSISAYGRTGPWAQRRGFDSLVQLATGLADDARIAYGRDEPVPLPAQALDHATGWLAAFGTLVALERRVREGGSWRVDLSLARTAEWLASLGPCDAPNVPMPHFEDAGDLLEDMPTPFGNVTHMRSPLRLDGIRVESHRPPPIFGAPLW